MPARRPAGLVDFPGPPRLFLLYSYYQIFLILLERLNMAKKQSSEAGCCAVEAVVTVDSRGQVVLPKEVRDDAGIAAGDKLAVVTMKNGGTVCCISLIKVESLAGTVRDILGPVAREIADQEVGYGQ
jgi:antitoxin PrlF